MNMKIRLITIISALVVWLIFTPAVYATSTAVAAGFIAPINNSAARIIKKPFGIYVSPGHSPVTPEKFHGYHTGVDFEIFANETSTPVEIYTICTGKLLVKTIARGYGGMVVQSCTLDKQPITVVYGHLKIKSVTNTVGKVLKRGAILGVLGRGYSPETSGERKHLHLGIHLGKKVDTRGYVQNKKELKNWLDFSQYLK